jgi:hypothetical protein
MADHIQLYHKHLVPPSSSAAPSIRSLLLKQSQDAQVKSCSEAFRRKMDEQYRKLFIENCLALNVADSSSIIRAFHFATGGAYMPPARTKLTADIDQYYYEMVNRLLLDVKSNTLSITTDAGTLTNGLAYITVTGHYITEQWEMRDVVLLVHRMVGSHTGEYVRDLLDLTIQAWETEGRVFAGVTDNGANFAKGPRISQQIDNALRCAVHTLQLALKDAVKQQPSINQLCKDAQALVKAIRRSSFLTEQLLDIQKVEAAADDLSDSDEHERGLCDDVTRPLKLALNVKTRFNSMCILFSRLLEVKSAVQRLCIEQASNPDFNYKALSNEQWDQIYELVVVLSPVKEVCDSLEGSSTPSLSLLIPLVWQLINTLAEINKILKLPTTKVVCAAVRSSVYERMESALKEPSSRIALMLDPRVRSKRIPNHDRATSIKALSDAFLDFPSVLAAYRGTSAPALRHRDAIASSDGKEEKEEESIEQAVKRRKVILSHLTEEPRASVVISEMDLYLNEEGIALTDCPLEWWKKKATAYPVLSEMARVYLAVPATSAPSERVFSVGKLILDEKRRRLDEGRVARLMFCKRNMGLYERLVGTTLYR